MSIIMNSKLKLLLENHKIKSNADEELNRLPQDHPNRGSLFLATKAKKIAEARDKAIIDNYDEYLSREIQNCKPMYF